jgi:hypothetical protein
MFLFDAAAQTPHDWSRLRGQESGFPLVAATPVPPEKCGLQELCIFGPSKTTDMSRSRQRIEVEGERTLLEYKVPARRPIRAPVAVQEGLPSLDAPAVGSDVFAGVVPAPATSVPVAGIAVSTVAAACGIRQKKTHKHTYIRRSGIAGLHQELDL